MTRYQRIVNDLHGKGFDFRINDIDESIEVKMSKDASWQPLSDTLIAIIEIEMSEMGYGVKGKSKPSLSFLQKAWVKLADNQRYHPVKDFFTGLEGKYQPLTPPGRTSPEPYYIFLISPYFDNPDCMFGKWLFRWMVGAIAKVFQQQRNPMLTLVGPQRIGKSRFSQWLCPLPNYYREGKIDPDNKDSRIRLLDTFIQEVPELGSTTKRADVEALKDHLTKMIVHERMPYARLPIRKPAICSFIGSVNPDGAGFLNDPTGSSRFLTCHINKIDFGYCKQNAHDLWSEAYWFYKNIPQSWELTPEEQATQDKINLQFEMVNALEDVIDAHFEITQDDQDYMPTLQIRQTVSLYYKYSSEAAFNRELAQVLHKKGLTRKREPFKEGQPHRWCWYGLKQREKE